MKIKTVIFYMIFSLTLVSLTFAKTNTNTNTNTNPLTDEKIAYVKNLSTSPITIGVINDMETENISSYFITLFDKTFNTYSNIKYGTKEELLTDLANGTVDIVPFLFLDDIKLINASASVPYMREPLYIYTSDLILNNNYSTIFKNKEIGILKDHYNYFSFDLNEFLVNKNFNTSVVVYDNINDMSNAYKNKQIDYFIYTDSKMLYMDGLIRRSVPPTLISRDYYVGIKNSKDTSLLSSLLNNFLNTDTEISLIQYNHDLFINNLSTGKLYTDDELQYLNENSSLNVLFNKDLYPISSLTDDNEIFAGYSVSIFEDIFKIANIDYTFNKNNLKDTDVIGQYLSHDVLDDNVNYSTYSSSPIYVVGKKDNKEITSIYDIYHNNVGVISGSDENNYIDILIPFLPVTTFTSTSNMIDAYKIGEIDYMILPEDIYHILYKYDLFNVKIDYIFDAYARRSYSFPNNESAKTLSSIFNKSLSIIDYNKIISDHTRNNDFEYMMLYTSSLAHKLLISFTIIFILIIIFIIKNIINYKKFNKYMITTTDNIQKVIKATNSGSFTFLNDVFTFSDHSCELLGLDLDLDLDNNILTVDECFAYTSKNIVTDDLVKAYHLMVNGELDKYVVSVNWYRHKDMLETIYVEFTFLVEKNIDNEVLITGFIIDKTEEYQYDMKIKNALYIDILTGAKNRNALYMHGSNFNKVFYENMSVIYLDINNFRQINDTYGYDYGDIVLKDIYNRINKLDYIDSIYRICADEFLLLSFDFTKEHCMNLLSVLNEPIIDDSFHHLITTKFGVVNASQFSNLNLDELVNLASFTMLHSASLYDNGFSIADDNIYNRYVINNEIKNKLESAIADGGIVAYFQPYTNINTEKIVGFETLVRWVKDDKILYYPDQFLPVAYEKGYIFDIDLKMFEESIKFLSELKEKNLIDESFAITSNFSANSLKRLDVETLLNIVDKYNISPSEVCVEVTEQIFMNANSMQNIENIAKAGFKIAIDDFSVGYSSLVQLRNLKIDYLKIDMSLLTNIENSVENQKIYNTIVNLGHILDVKIVSEGVEVDSEINAIRDMGVDIAQGFYFSRPINKSSMLQNIVDKNL